MPKLVTADLTLEQLAVHPYRRKMRATGLNGGIGSKIVQVTTRRTRGTVLFEDVDPLDCSLTYRLAVEWEEPTEEERAAKELEDGIRYLRMKAEAWRNAWFNREKKMREALAFSHADLRMDSFMLAGIVEDSRRSIVARQVLEVLDDEELDNRAKLDCIRRKALVGATLHYVPNSTNNQSIELKLHETAAWAAIVDTTDWMDRSR